MTIRFHPAPATLMSYAAGGLGEAFAILVASHAEACAACRDAIGALHDVGGALLCDAPAAPVAEADFARLLARLDEAPPAPRLPPAPAAAPGLPDALARLVGGGADAVPWRRIAPGLEMARIGLAGAGGEQGLRFLRADPGVGIPDHGHPGAELTLVVAGWLRDGENILGAGDVGEQDEGVRHAPAATGDVPCLCVIAEEGPPRFAGG